MLHDKVNNLSTCSRLKVGAVQVTVFVNLVGYGFKLVLLLDNRMGVLLTTAGAGLPNRTLAGIWPKLY